MKLILSRKGVDSSSGGFASPIFIDERMQSVPIPDRRSPVGYEDISGEPDLGRLVAHLSAGSINEKTPVHVDPDLDPLQLPRHSDWRPLFGQCGAAQSHLEKQGIRQGDLFVFFGWFRKVEYVRRKWRYVPATPDLHVIFGWLQIGRIYSVADLVKGAGLPAKQQWLNYHPHCHGRFSGVNTLYEAKKTLSFPGFKQRGVDGAGVFGRYSTRRQLTAFGRSRSIWSLPHWMHPKGRASSLSYHADLSRWNKNQCSTELRSAASGQEFVLDLEHYPEACDWLADFWAD